MMLIVLNEIFCPNGAFTELSAVSSCGIIYTGVRVCVCMCVLACMCGSLISCRLYQVVVSFSVHMCVCVYVCLCVCMGV